MKTGLHQHQNIKWRKACETVCSEAIHSSGMSIKQMKSEMGCGYNRLNLKTKPLSAAEIACLRFIATDVAYPTNKRASQVYFSDESEIAKCEALGLTVEDNTMNRDDHRSRNTLKKKTIYDFSRI